MEEGQGDVAGVDDGEPVRTEVDVSAARQRAEEILALQPGSKGWNAKLADAARDLARDVVALADRVEAADKERDATLNHVDQSTSEWWKRAIAAEKALQYLRFTHEGCIEIAADMERERDAETRRAVAAEARAAELEKALHRAQQTVTAYYTDHIEEGDPPCPCDACAKARAVFVAALSSSASPDTEATK